jgi:hypothetical protein
MMVYWNIQSHFILIKKVLMYYNAGVELQQNSNQSFNKKKMIFI